MEVPSGLQLTGFGVDGVPALGAPEVPPVVAGAHPASRMATRRERPAPAAVADVRFQMILRHLREFVLMDAAYEDRRNVCVTRADAMQKPPASKDDRGFSR